MLRDIEHHQSFLGNGRLHAGRFAHQSHVDAGQERECHLNAVLARHFFFAGSQVNHVISLRLARECAEHLQEAYHAGTVVVSAQAIQPPVFPSGSEGVFGPAGSRLHGVDMCVQQKGGAAGVEAGRDAPQVVASPVGVQPVFVHEMFQQVGHFLFFPADGRDADHGFQQAGGFLGQINNVHDVVLGHFSTKLSFSAGKLNILRES